MKILGKCPTCGLYLCAKDKTGLYTITCPRCRHATDENESRPLYLKDEEDRIERFGLRHYTKQELIKW